MDQFTLKIDRMSDDLSDVVTDDEGSEDLVIDVEVDKEDTDLNFGAEVDHKMMFLQEERTKLDTVLAIYALFMPSYVATMINDTTVRFELPTSFVPLSVAAVLGFAADPVILQVDICFNEYSWKKKANFTCVHPRYGSNFIGKPVIMSTIERFFSAAYVPQPTYQCEMYMTSQAAAIFVQTRTSNRVTFSDCPLVYLLLELTETFVNLSDHCCMCNQVLAKGVKVSVCSKEFCNFQLAEIGVGNSVLQEIARDPEVADLVFSMFSATFQSKYCTPAPPKGMKIDIARVFQTLPAMEQMATRCHKEKDLVKMIGIDAVKLLRWVLFSNRSHLIAIPPEMQLREFAGTRQFMALLGSPEAEDVFNRLKSRYGSCYMWHGSDTVRWHSILRNGLKNASGTALQANGAVLGPGIYFASNSGVSWGYVRQGQNAYRCSSLGQTISAIALCEVVKLPPGQQTVSLPKTSPMNEAMTLTGALTDKQRAHTLTMEQACVVRFLFVSPRPGAFQIDTLRTPPANVPTLDGVLHYFASKKSH